MSSDYFWIGLGFIIFLVVAWRPGKRAILGAIDGRIMAIRKQIEEAKALRAEAEAQLRERETLAKGAFDEATEIVRAANYRAERQAASLGEHLAGLAARREAQAHEKIAQLESQALGEVRMRAVAIAMQAARDVLVSKASGPAGHALINQAIQEIPRQLQTHAQARS